MRLGRAWFTTHARAVSRWKLLVLDDVGALHLDGGVLGFTGRKYDFDLTDVRSVRVATLRVAWGVMIPSLLGCILLVPCIPFPCYALLLSDDVAARVVGGAVVGLFVGGWYLYLALRLPYLWRTPWVCVEHGTRSGAVTFSYFALCNDRGSAVRRPETRELVERLRADLEAGRLARRAAGPGPRPGPSGPAGDGIQRR